MNNRISSALLAAAVLGLAACDPKNETPTPLTADNGLTNKVVVVNEGTTNGALSVFDKATRSVVRDAYAPANGNQPLGPVVQSLTVVGSTGYAVVNGADQVQVLSLPGFQRTGTIGGLSQPRYLVAASPEKAYLSEWQGPYTGYLPGRVAVLDLRTNAVSRRIAVGTNPEQLLLLGTKLYVPNAEDSTITVINTATDAVESTIRTAAGPKGLVLDAAGNIWVLCNKYLASTASLVRFNPATPSTQVRIPIANSYLNSNLRRNAAGTTLYVSLASGTYAFDYRATALPARPLLSRNFYGLGIDPADGTIYAGTGTFTGSDKVIRYTPAGAAIDSFGVGVAPNSFYFK